MKTTWGIWGRLFVMVLALAVSAVNGEPSGSVVGAAFQTKYAGGSGTADDPYQIGSAADLLALAADANDYDKCFILTADIDLSSYSFTTAVIAPDTTDTSTPPGVPAFDGTAFTGTFDGSEHKIINLTINTNGAGNDWLGLFGEIAGGGKVKELGLENVSITSGDQSYYLGGLAGYNSGTIINCYATGAVTGHFDLGGLMGRNYDPTTPTSAGTIINCYSTVAVTGGPRVGGLAGSTRGGSIVNCYSTGVVSGTSSVGGLVGKSEYGYNIASCYFLDTSGPDNGYGTPLTDAEMKQQSSFIGWDFVYVWQISEGVSYPELRVPGTYSGGSGSTGDPYQIATAEDLLVLAANMCDYDRHFILTADIDLDPVVPGNRVFTTALIAADIHNTDSDPEWFDGLTFTGTFDGSEHKIINLTINTNGGGNDRLGLFGVVGGEIRDLGLENVSITGGDGSEALGGLAGTGGNISNCYSTGTVAAGSASERLGGLAGTGGNISNCYSTVAVAGGSYVGGLVGTSYDSISNCYSAGDVTGTNDVGGLVGRSFGAISSCYSTGDVTGTNEVGGLVGKNWSGTVVNCYSTRNVSGGSGVGGLVGVNGHHVVEGTVTNCYATGNVSGTNYVGGLVGLQLLGSVNSSYFLDTSGPDNGLGTPLTDAQMKQQSSYVAWDFLTIWDIIEGLTYPFFMWCPPTSVDPLLPGHVPATSMLVILSLAPNPFGLSMEVSLQSRVSGPVTMEIYNVSGQLVRSVLLGDLGPGLHQARWDGRDAGGANVSSGVYFIQVRNPVAESPSVKAVLVR